MRFVLKYRVPGSNKIIFEEYDKDVLDADRWCRDTLKAFNASLRPGEHERIYMGCEVLDEGDTHKEHCWEKLSLVTETGKYGGTYDRVRCSYCGATGKRHGLGHTVRLDGQLNRKQHLPCRDIRLYLEAREKRKKVW
jgi:hypothetical protein